jgi:hypothetical protein
MDINYTNWPYYMYSKWPKTDQPFPIQGPQTFTQIGNFGLKKEHLATLLLSTGAFLVDEVGYFYCKLTPKRPLKDVSCVPLRRQGKKRRKKFRGKNFQKNCAAASLSAILSFQKLF